jgi:hypothetical protein
MVIYYDDKHTDVVTFLNIANGIIKLRDFDINDHLTFNDYPFIFRFGKRIWLINNSDLNTFIDIIQDKIMEYNRIDDKVKDRICLDLQLWKNNLKIR